MPHPIEQFLPTPQETPYRTTAYIPKESKPSTWLTPRNVSIAALTLGTGAAVIGTAVYLANSMFTETITDQFMSSNDTAPLNYTDSPFNHTNPSINYILEIYKNVQASNLTECTPGFTKYWERVQMNGLTLCNYVRHAINLFKDPCPDTPASCQDVANVMKECQEFMSEEFPDC